MDNMGALSAPLWKKLMFSPMTCCALLVLSHAGWAQSNAPILEEIIVTAQKRVQSVQDVPISISVIGGQRLDETDIRRIRDLQTYVPHLAASETALNSNISMRGIFSGSNQGFEQSFGTYVDGIYRGRSQQTRALFLDLDRVEVLRGSQNILFGHNSLAGALNLTSARPTDVAEGALSFLYEPELEKSEISAMISGPLSQQLSGRLAARFRESDGYIDNLTLGRSEPQRDEQILRGSLAWNNGENLDIYLKVEASTFDVVGRQAEVIADNPATSGPFAGLNYSQILVSFGQDPSVLNTVQDYARSANQDFSDNETNEAVFSIDYDFGSMTLSSVTGFSSYKFNEVCDCDFTGGNVLTVPQREEYDQFSQEFRLTSPGGARLDFLAGLYYQTSDLDFFDMLAVDNQSILISIVNALTMSTDGDFLADTGTPRFFSQSTESFSAFGQVLWSVGDQLQLIGGLRVTDESKSATRSLDITDINTDPLAQPAATVAPILYATLFNVRAHTLSGKRSETLVMPSISLLYDFSGDAMGYLTYTRGAKAGGFDPRSNNPISAGGGFEFKDETADNFEAGAKLQISDGAAELNVALFHVNIQDMQVSTYDGSLGFNVTNAGEAVTQGIELDGRWAVTENLTLAAALGLVDFEFKDYIGQCYFGQIPDAPDGINCNYAGKTNQYVTKYSGIISADYFRPISDKLVVRATFDVGYTDDYFRTPTLDPQQVQKGYETINLRLSLGDADQRWEIAVLGKNLTDNAIVGYSIDTPLAGQIFGAPGVWGFAKPPRTVALYGTVAF